MRISLGQVDPTQPRQWGAAGCLLIFIVLILLQRYHTYGEALERDIAGYAVIAHEMLQGRNLYSDLWERKPPLLYATFALAQLLCGYGPREIFFLNIVAATTTLIALYFAGKRLGGSKAAGLFSAFLWVLIGGDLGTQANQPNAEVFVNACLSIAFALLLYWPNRQKLGAALLLGMLLVSATLYKQHVLVTCALLLTAHLLGAFCAEQEARRNLILARIKEVMLAALVIVGTWLAIAGYFIARHRFSLFFGTLLRQNLSYSGDVRHNLLSAFQPRNLFPEFAPWALVFPVLIAGAVVLHTGEARKLNRLHPHLLLWLGWACGSAITFVLPGKFFGHYYQLWIPVWCVAGGWALAALARETAPRLRFINRLLIAGAIGCLLGLEGNPYLLSADDWTRQKYPVDDFIQERKMGIALQQLVPPGHCFYNLGEDTPLYFYSKRSPASGLLYLGPLETGSEMQAYRQRLMNDLVKSRPDLIITSTLRNTTLRKAQDLTQWILSNYTPVENNLGCPIYRVLVRNDSILAGQLKWSQKNVVELDLR